MPVLSRFAAVPRRLNPWMLPVAARVPPLAVLHHRGRTSGRGYDTPVVSWRDGDTFVVALAYDRDADWALNLLHAGGGEMTRGGRRYTVHHVRRGGPDLRDELRGPASLVTRAPGVDDFLAFDATPVG